MLVGNTDGVVKSLFWRNWQCEMTLVIIKRAALVPAPYITNHASGRMRQRCTLETAVLQIV